MATLTENMAQLITMRRGMSEDEWRRLVKAWADKRRQETN